MKRISTSTRVVNKFGAGKDGFTDGSVVGGVQATDLEASFFDHVQEELANAVEARGVVLDPADRGQLAGVLVGRLIGLRKLETVGSGLFTSSAGTRFSVAEGVGGGGAGGGTPSAGAGNAAAAGGGGSGGYGRKLIMGALNAVPYNVGAAGVGVLGANGGTGGTTSIGSLMTCAGGAGGNVATPTSGVSFGSTPGGSGVVTGADIAVNSTPAVLALQFGSLAVSGSGGSSALGGGSNGVAISGTNAAHGNSPASFGKGGGGAGGVSVGAAANTRGGDGQPGGLYMWEYA